MTSRPSWSVTCGDTPTPPTCAPDDLFGARRPRRPGQPAGRLASGRPLRAGRGRAPADGRLTPATARIHTTTVSTKLAARDHLAVHPGGQVA